jgi:hypothetical protein
MKFQILYLMIGVALTSCIPDWEPIVPADNTNMYHRNDTLSLQLSFHASQSNQQYIDTLSVVGYTFDLILEANPSRGHGTLYVMDRRDSILLTWSFQESDHRRQSFDRRPYRTILKLTGYTGTVWLAIYGRKWY